MELGRRIRGAKVMHPVLPKSHASSPNCPKSVNKAEDKELRKKLRNRQSALAARERKKAKMIQLEQTVAKLQRSNEKLVVENSKLRQTLAAHLYSSQGGYGACYGNDRSAVASVALDTESSTAVSGCKHYVEDKVTNIRKIAYAHHETLCAHGGKISSPIEYLVSSKSCRAEVSTNQSPLKIVSKRPIKSEENMVASGLHAPRRASAKSSPMNTDPTMFQRHMPYSKTKFPQTDSHCSKGYFTNISDSEGHVFLNDEKASRQTLQTTESIVNTRRKSPCKDWRKNDPSCSMPDPVASKEISNQRLPSIDVVLATPPKLDKINSFNYQSHSVDHLKRHVSDLIQRKERPEKEAGWSRESSKDPSPYQVNDIVSFQFMLNSPRPSTSNFLPFHALEESESHCTDPSHNNVQHEAGNSLLKNSDREVGVDDDPSDWIPDTSFLTFE